MHVAQGGSAFYHVDLRAKAFKFGGNLEKNVCFIVDHYAQEAVREHVWQRRVFEKMPQSLTELQIKIFDRTPPFAAQRSPRDSSADSIKNMSFSISFLPKMKRSTDAVRVSECGDSGATVRKRSKCDAYPDLIYDFKLSKCFHKSGFFLS